MVLIVVKKRTIFLCVTAVILVTFLFSIGWGRTLSVLNYLTGNPIYKGDENKPQVAFECNVVWGTEYVPLMLDIFKENNIKITFFIGGAWAKQNPDLLKRMINEGHEIGNHGYDHKYHSKLNLEDNRKEIIRTEMVIKEIAGIKTRLFAPPYGDFNKTTLQAAQSLGYKTIMWSIDTIDWRRDGAHKITERVLKNPHNGAFILMHPTEDTVKALPGIINQLGQGGYQIGTISDLLAK